MSGIGGASRSGDTMSEVSGGHDFEGTTRSGRMAGFEGGQRGTTGSGSAAASFKAELKQMLAKAENSGSQQSDGSGDDMLQALKKLLSNEAGERKKHSHHLEADATSTTASTAQATPAAL